ncbi:MAG: hypothetical protein RLZZ450_3599 [Pseudomonadota bacterium]|jgi:hypothetical protein
MLARINQFNDWLAATSLSVGIQSVSWLIPAVQTVHILAIAALIGASLAVSLRLLGVSAQRESSRDIAARYLPIVWWALPILFVSGSVLIIAEPARSLANPIFAIKMGLLSIASLVTLTFQLPLRRDAEFWSATRSRVIAAKSLAILSFGLWVGVIFAGRWIAYVEAM